MCKAYFKIWPNACFCIIMFLFCCKSLLLGCETESLCIIPQTCWDKDFLRLFLSEPVDGWQQKKKKKIVKDPDFIFLVCLKKM